MRKFKTREEANKCGRRKATLRAETPFLKGAVLGNGKGFTIRLVESGRYLAQGTCRGFNRGRSFGTRTTYEEADQLGNEVMERLREEDYRK